MAWLILNFKQDFVTLKGFDDRAKILENFKKETISQIRDFQKFKEICGIWDRGFLKRFYYFTLWNSEYCKISIKLWNLENGNDNNFEEYERKKYKKRGNNECKLLIIDLEQIGNFFRFLEFFLFYITFMKNCFLKIISWKSELSYD